QQQRGPTIPLARAAPGAPAGLVAAIERCLAYEPQERWRRASDLCVALEGLGDQPARRVASGWRRAWARAAQAPGAARRRRERRAAFFRSRPAPRLVLEAVRDDLRYTLRGLAKAPGFAAAAILTFALGVGANSTMFGVVDRLLLRPPAHVREPERVVRLAARMVGETTGGQRTFSYPVYKAVRDRVRSFEVVAMSAYAGVPWGRGDQARGLDGLLVSASYFPLLGVRPHLGRFILPEEDVEPVGAPVVVISYGFWMRQFAGDRRVIGRTLELGQRRYMIIGVTPPGFTGTELSAPDVWIPITASQGRLQADAGWATRGGSTTWLSIYARLRPGVAPHWVSGETMRAMRAAAPDAFYVGPNRRIIVEPIIVSRAESAGVGAQVTTLLAAMSILVLLIACANVINLLLARGLRRRREIAVRLALGVSRGRLVGQLLAESVLLALLGGAAALLVAYWGGGLVRTLLFGDITWADAPVDRRVLGFTMLLALVAGVLAGLLPALQTSRPELTSALKAGAREGGATRSRTRTALLIMQAALSVVLLVGTGLFVRSLGRISQIRLGVDVDRVLLGRMDLRATGRSPADADAVFGRVLDRVRGLPGVQSAAVAATVPFSESFGAGVVVPGHDPRSVDDPHFYNAVTPGYFATIGAPLLAGRDFGPGDHAASARVVIISEAMARRYWPRESAVGNCIFVDSDTPPCAQVVGVAADVKRQGVFEEDRMFVYAPLAQAPRIRSRRLVVRPAGDDPARLIEPVRRAMQTAVPGLPYASVGLLRDMTNVRQQLRPWQLGAAFFGAFGALALLLAAVGLYGVVSYTVTQRTHEMGVRVALGAQARDVARLVMREGVGVTAAGAAIGVAAALAGGRFVQSLLYEVSAWDPLVFAAVAVTLLAVAVAATLVPAWRATRVDPVVALRAE
ncbi:MAG: ABC transporter permease, partial [Gemmatimonadaceae bacterium]